MFRLKLFGSASIEGPDGPLTGRAAQRRRLALLALLAVARERGLTREKLVGYLWPDADPERARHLLSDSIYRINQAVGGEAIVAIGEELRLDPARLPSDAWAFAEALQQGEWRRAVELQGAPFLDGFFLTGADELERWADAQRERLVRERARALEALAEGAERAGEGAEAVRWWRVLAAQDPYSSRVALRLMRALERSGDAAAALRHAQAHAALLKEELGLEPDPELVALVDGLRVPASRTGGEARGVSGAPAASRVAKLEAGRSGAPAESSIAVLPFVNRSANPDDEYFADGLSDELIGVLGRIDGLRVSARASSFHFKGTNTPLAEIGRALDVATLLDGSVRTSAGRVRISVQLVKVPEGYALWSQTYDRTLEDVLAVQDDIAQSVVEELRVALLGERRDAAVSGRARAEVDRAARGRSGDAEAHRLHLLARYFMDRFSREDTARAIGYLEQAVARDPDFALAWAELSVAYVREVGFGLVPPEEGYDRARRAVARSLTLEPALADGHAQIAWIRIFLDRDWQGAGESLERALALAPGSAAILRLSGVLASVLGDPREAIRTYRRALEQDPLSAAAYHSLGLALQAVEDLEGAEEAFRKALELAPQRIGTRAQLAVVALLRGRPAEALEEAAREPEEGYRLWATGLVQHARGDAAAADAALQALTDGHADGWALQIAQLYAVRGHTASAFSWLDRAFATRAREPGLVHIRTDPRLQSLHGDPRWHRLLRRLRLEP